jgi:hypothetical protein
MGLTKRIWIERDPAYEDVRQRLLESAKLHEFAFRIATRRKNRMSPGPRWCPLWANCLDKAARQLSIETRLINDGVFFRAEFERDAVLALAEQFWEKRLEALLR